MKTFSRLLPLSVWVLVCLAARTLPAQDWIRTGSNLGNERIRLAAADFKPLGDDPQTPALKAAFDATLFSDLANAGIFDLVSKSMAPQAMPGSPQEIDLAAVVGGAGQRGHGGLRRALGRAMAGSPSTAGSSTRATPSIPRCWASSTTKRPARIWRAPLRTGLPMRSSLRLGGGINGIAETKIYFVSSRSGTKEIWAMDYDGQNQHQITHLGTHFALAAHLAGQHAHRLRIAGPRGMGHPDVLAGTWPAGELSRRHGRRQQPVPGLVGRRRQDRLLVVALGRPGDLGGRRERRQSAPADQLRRTRRRAHLESAHQRADWRG